MRIEESYLIGVVMPRLSVDELDEMLEEEYEVDEIKERRKKLKEKKLKNRLKKTKREDQ